MDSIPQKRCTKCGVEFPATFEYFYMHNQSGNFRPTCKACTNKANNNWRNTPAGKKASRQYEKNYTGSEHGREMRRQKTARYRENNPQKEAARHAVSSAVHSKKLPHVKTLICLHCDSMAETYHHWSYEPEHWLDVIPLCIKCHNKVHGK